MIRVTRVGVTSSRSVVIVSLTVGSRARHGNEMEKWKNDKQKWLGGVLAVSASVTCHFQSTPSFSVTPARTYVGVVQRTEVWRESVD
jgi:hypothetical protein